MATPLPLAGLVALCLNSGTAIYLSRDDPLSVACIALSSSALLLTGVLLVLSTQLLRHYGWSSTYLCLKATIWCLMLLLAVLAAYGLVRTAPPSTPLLLGAVAGVMALSLGGCCAFMLHQRSWSTKQSYQEALHPLMQESP